MLLTLLAWQLARRYDALERGGRFYLESEEMRRAIAFRMQTYVSALEQARGLFSGAHEVTRDDFRAYVHAMDLDARYPGALAIGFVKRVPAAERAAFETGMRRAGFPDFHVWPTSPGDAYPVVFIEPFDERNRRAFGFDMYSEPVRREAMDRAARGAAAAATPVLTIVQEKGERNPQPGFLIFVAAYRGAELVGFTYSPFRAGDLFRGVFSRDPLALDTMGYEVFDGTRPIREALMYASATAPSEPEQERLATIEVAGRLWTLRLFALPAFYAVHDGRTPLVVLLLGALVSGLVFYLLLANHRHALQLARLLAQERSAAAAAQSAVRTRDDVLAVVSHDLRNPVSSILLNARVLAQRLPSGDELGRRALGGIQRGAEGMRLLIGDLVDLVRIDSGLLVVEPKAEEAAGLVRDAVDLIAPIADARQLVVSVELPPDAPRVLCDRDRILQVFSNLLGNAVKFTPPGGKIGVLMEDLGDRVRFCVTDTGPGLSPEAREHAFERFWQGNPTSKGGTGLGLYIVRALVVAHGGEVTVKSTLGQGATFCFTIPKAAAE
ncbi:MAG TPA: CHASE domain-containing protein [Myxococcales bacterium]|nr:CHASE domain-containing protein [Myxococcales bacterium]